MSEIGETLRERRMSLKIDVNEVEEATKIRSKYLRALENEEYDLLPGSAYVKSFLRTYADYLGLDSRALLNQYRSLGHAQEDDPMVYTPQSTPAQRRPPRWMLIVAIVVIVVVIVFAVGALSGSGGG